MIDTVNFRILWEEFLLRYEKYCLGMRKGIVIYYSFFLYDRDLYRSIVQR